MSAATFANRLWEIASVPAARRFRRAVLDPELAQTQLLQRILRANQATELGQALGFGAIRTLDDWRERVPLQSWEEIGPAVERIAQGERGVLTAEPVVLLEPTGGSSGGTKHIPFTRTLQGQIREAVAVWMSDLFAKVPAVRGGPAYWSISPAMGPPERTPGGIPVGFEDDGAYLSPLHSTLAASVMAVPGEVRGLIDIDDFRYATLRFLVARADLALISVWNPSFLTLIVERLRPWGDRLASDLDRGTLTLAEPSATETFGRLKSNTEAAARLRAALMMPTESEMLTVLWPRLALISAWADAMAVGPARNVSVLFPNARFQPKGLIATEGIVSIPLVGQDGAALALTSHVIELVPTDGGGALFAHEARVGETYSVLLTTGGGLTRYPLGDLVEVVGMVGKCPLVRFLGREGTTSDLVGEKLDERFVAHAFAEMDLDDTFRLLAPVSGSPPAYCLFVESDAVSSRLRESAARLDVLLRDNVHYAHARRLGQLGPPLIFRVREHGARSYLDGCVLLGQRLGNVKPSALHRDIEWADRFDGEWIAA